jgi:plastocyanin
MKRTNFRSAILILMFLAVSSVAIFNACSKDSNGYGNNGGNNGGGNNGDKVSISNFAFSVGTLTVAKGTTVTWTNNDATAHTVTADDGSFTSGSIAQGGTFTHAFSTAGTFAYHCNFHPMMKASVKVNE